MDYKQFLTYNNLSKAVPGIVILSVLPMVWHAVKETKTAKSHRETLAPDVTN